jgi:hypothetical protein
VGLKFRSKVLPHEVYLQLKDGKRYPPPINAHKASKNFISACFVRIGHIQQKTQSIDELLICWNRQKHCRSKFLKFVFWIPSPHGIQGLVYGWNSSFWFPYELWTQKDVKAWLICWNFVVFMYISRVMCNHLISAAILYFWLPVSSGTAADSTIGDLTSKTWE